MRKKAGWDTGEKRSAPGHGVAKAAKQGVLFSAIFLLSLKTLAAVQITATELNHSLKAEYNRSFLLCLQWQASGRIELDNGLRVAAGLASGAIGSGEETENRFFAQGSAAPFALGQLRVELSYIVHALPGYQMRSGSVRPRVSWDGGRWGAGLGLNLQRTTFFGEYSVFEPVWIFSANFDIINGRDFSLGIKGANYSDFDPGNMAKYSFTLTGEYRMREHIFLTGSFEFMQSGSIILAATFYGVAFTGGVRFSW